MKWKDTSRGQNSTFANGLIPQVNFYIVCLSLGNLLHVHNCTFYDFLIVNHTQRRGESFLHLAVLKGQGLGMLVLHRSPRTAPLPLVRT